MVKVLHLHSVYQLYEIHYMFSRAVSLISISGISPFSHFGDSLLLTTSLFLKSVPYMVCRNICDRLYSKVVFGISNYSLGHKYCRRCEVYLCSDSMFCPCCGMQLRIIPSSRKCKETFRRRKSRYTKIVDR